MPKEYEAIRDSLESRGDKPKEAKRIAAATYNSRHPGGPFVTGRHESAKKRRPEKHPGEALKGKHGY